MHINKFTVFGIVFLGILIHKQVYSMYVCYPRQTMEQNIARIIWNIFSYLNLMRKKTPSD